MGYFGFKSQNMRYLLPFCCLVLLSIANPIHAQNSINKEVDSPTYRPTVLPKDTCQLWIGDGDIDADTVLIVGEGGPKRHLDFEASGRVYWEYLPGHERYYIAVVHQSSTYNPSIFGATDFSLEDAFHEVDNTSEMLYRAIQYFKDRNKYVVVLGHSYSAFVIPHYLSTRPSIADKYLITGGRLNAHAQQTAYQLKGLNTGFEEDGISLIEPDETTKPSPYRRRRSITIRKNKELLKYAIGQPRYTEELKDVDLSNLIFYYGLKDQNVGALTTKEQRFLVQKKATVVGVDTGHYKIWQRVIDAFRDGHIRL